MATPHPTPRGPESSALAQRPNQVGLLARLCFSSPGPFFHGLGEVLPVFGRHRPARWRGEGCSGGTDNIRHTGSALVPFLYLSMNVTGSCHRDTVVGESC